MKVFLCHSSNDKTVVRTLYRQLSSVNGLAPWLDEVNLLPGEDWHYEITKAIEDTDVVIVCVSRNMISKEGYIQKEIKHALDVADEKPEGSVFIIPVLLEPCDIPRRLSKWQWLHYSTEGAFERLMRALQKRAQDVGLEITLS